MVTTATVSMWIAAVEVAFGLLAIGYRARTRAAGTEFMAPLGAMFVISGAFRLLTGYVPDGVLIPVAGAGMIGVVAWFIRVMRLGRQGRQAVQRGGRPTAS